MELDLIERRIDRTMNSLNVSETMNRLIDRDRCRSLTQLTRNADSDRVEIREAREFLAKRSAK